MGGGGGGGGGGACLRGFKERWTAGMRLCLRVAGERLASVPMRARPPARPSSQRDTLCVRAHARERVCAYACVRACVRICFCLCVCVCVRVCVWGG